MIATLLDEVAAWTIIVQLARLGVTQEITIRYFKPVWTNTEIIAEGQIVHHDRRKATLRSTVHDANGTLLAESESKWLLPGLSNISKISGIDKSILQQFLAHYSPQNNP